MCNIECTLTVLFKILEVIVALKTPRQSPRHIKPPIQWVPGALIPGVNGPGCKADHSPLSSAEVRNELSYTSTPPVCLHGMQKDFTFLLY
jgi:hypothetical protein